MQARNQDLQSQITTQNPYIQATQQSLVNKLSAMETTLSALQTAAPERRSLLSVCQGRRSHAK